MKNIFPIFDKMISRSSKEELLSQRSLVLWFTGLSSSGKTTLARATEKNLHSSGFATTLLDGDNIRSGINKYLSFSVEDRKENIRRISEVAKLFVDNGIITIASFISPEEEMREMAREIVGANDFYEIHIDCPVEFCEARDKKGLYKRARAGEIKNFTGVNSKYESPKNPFLKIETHKLSIDESLKIILDKIKPLINL